MTLSMGTVNPHSETERTYGICQQCAFTVTAKTSSAMIAAMCDHERWHVRRTELAIESKHDGA